MTEIAINAPGHVHIADEVIAVIAGTAALEAEGVSGLMGNFTGDIVEKLGLRNLSKGVTIAVAEGAVQVSVDVAIKSGMKVQEVCFKVQQKIKTAIETMTGLSVDEVNVNVGALLPEKQKTNP